MLKNKFKKMLTDLEDLGYSHQELAACIGVSYGDFSTALKKEGYKHDFVKKLSEFFDIKLEDDLKDKRNLSLEAEVKHFKNVSDVLRFLMEDIGGISEGELHRRTGVPQPTIHRILSGMTPHPRIQAIQPLADFFNVTPDQLLARVPLSKERVPGTFDSTVLARKSLPVLSLEDAIKWPAFMRKITQSHWKNWLTTETIVGERSFAVHLEKDSNFRMFKKDSILIIDYSKKPLNGSYVLMQSSDAMEGLIARLNMDNKSFILSDGVSKSKSISMTKKMRVLGVIVEIRQTLV